MNKVFDKMFEMCIYMMLVFVLYGIFASIVLVVFDYSIPFNTGTVLGLIVGASIQYKISKYFNKQDSQRVISNELKLKNKLKDNPLGD